MYHCIQFRTSFSGHLERCLKEKQTNFGFIWKDENLFGDHHMKISLSFRVYADFECINQPVAHHAPNPSILLKQIPIELGYYIVSPFGKEYKSSS